MNTRSDSFREASSRYRCFEYSPAGHPLLVLRESEFKKHELFGAAKEPAEQAAREYLAEVNRDY